MSEVVDADLPPAFRAHLLSEIRDYLPAFLHRGASEQHDPLGDVRELLNLELADLRRVVAVHCCLDDAVIAFGKSLRQGMRAPLASSVRPPDVGQAVRGPVDWSATVARRAQAGGDQSLFVVRSAQRVLDTPENRALLWVLRRLRVSTEDALRRLSAEPTEGREGDGWVERIECLARRIAETRRVGWLQGLDAEAPTTHTIARLKASRRGFYANHLAPAAEVLLGLESPSSEELAAVLCKRYFEPAPTWLVFEVFVALSLARAFAVESGRPRRTRLLVGSGRRGYARYSFDGAEVTLLYQAWPPGARSLRREASERHRLVPSSSRPDIFILRSGPDPDAAVIELKASRKSGYLGTGLSQLLGYVAEQPGWWGRNPCAWLVAPDSDAFIDRAPDESKPLWIVGANRIAAAAVRRFVPPGPVAEELDS